jgi:molybdopterin synthase catalytic subunit/molybdopterin converting factor small subunit
MRVRVLFFGMLRDLVGRSSELLELPPEASVSDLLACYRDLPRMSEFLPSLAISVNQEYARPDARLQDKDEVALLPPVSGGTSEGPPAGRTHLVRDRIDSQPLLAAIRKPSDGAVAVFEGIVRDHSRGRRTLFLEYEAYEPMAARELEKLATEALIHFAIRDVVMVHRLGRLEIGETSVLIAVASAHRAPAFEACRWLIDTLKQTVPVWKKEHFVDGAIWADGEPFPPDLAGGRATELTVARRVYGGEEHR